MPTANVSGSFTGTGWTINVTACNLDTDLTIIDFFPFISGSPASVNLFQKTSPTVLTYVGAALGASTPVIIQRRTPSPARFIFSFASRFSSDSWNKEVDRRVRLSEEYELNGIGPGSAVVAPVPQNAAYPTGWSGDTSFSATRNALYNILVTLAPSANPVFTGNVSVPTMPLNTSNSNAASTAYVINQLAGYAPLASPAFTGNATVVTQAVNDNSTKIANTAFVQAQALSTPSQSLNDNSSKSANTAYVNTANRPYLDVWQSVAQVVPNGTVTAITFATVVTDTASAYSAGAGTFTVPAGLGGLYLVDTFVGFTTTVTNLVIQLVVNGTLRRRMGDLRAGADVFLYLKGSALVNLAAGDVVTIRVIHTNSGATSRTISNLASDTYLSIMRLNV